MDKKNGFDLHFELRERGIVWQVVGFAVVGVVATSVLAIYSGSDELPFRFLDVATSKLSWAFVPTFAFVLDWSRAMFKRASDISRDARREIRDKGAREAEIRIQKALESKGIPIPPDVAEEIFNHKNGKTK